MLKPILKRTAALSTVLLCFPLGAQAASLSLREAVRSALVNNTEVAAADQDVRVLKTKSAQVRAHHLPQVSLDAGYTHLQQTPEMKIPEIDLTLPSLSLPLGPGGAKVPITLPKLPVRLPNIAMSRQDVTEATLGVQLPLFTGGRIRYNLEQVDHGVTALEARAQSKRNEIAYSVVKAYLSTVLAQRAAEVSDRAFLTVQEHEAQAAKAVKAGMIPRYELIRAQAEVANLDRRRLDAHNQADLALAFLADTIGSEEELTLTTPLKSGKDQSVELEVTVRDALQASQDLRALQARDRAYEAGKKAARAEMMPTLALVGGKELYNKGLFDSDLPLTSPGGFVGVVAHLPIFDGNLARSKEAEQEAMRVRNESDIQRLEHGIRLEVRKYALDLATARKALDAADKAVELAKENLRLATSRFAVGEGTGIEKMDAVLTLSIAETNREQARYQYDLAYYGLKKATGTIVAEF